MAFAFIQTKLHIQTSSTTNVVTLDTALTTNNLVVVLIRANNITSNVSSVTDNAGNTYSAAIGPITISGSARIWQYYGVQLAGGATTVTVTFDASVGSSRVVTDEFSGGATSNISVFDKSTSATGTGTSAAVSFSPTASGELIVAGMGGISVTSGHVAGANYTLALSGDTTVVTEYRLSGTTSETAPITWTNSSSWVELASAFIGDSGTTTSTSSTSSSSSTSTSTSQSTSTSISTSSTSSSTSTSQSTSTSTTVSGTTTSTSTSLSTSSTSSSTSISTSTSLSTSSTSASTSTTTLLPSSESVAAHYPFGY